MLSIHARELVTDERARVVLEHRRKEDRLLPLEVSEQLVGENVNAGRQLDEPRVRGAVYPTYEMRLAAS